MIIERIENRVGKDPLMEISGSSLEAKPEDCAVGSKFFCTDTRDTYEKTENEWKLISGGQGVSGGFSGVKIPKNCACFVTEYGDTKIIQEQSDDQYCYLDFSSVPIKGKNLGEGLANRGKGIATMRDGSNTLLGASMPWTLEEYDLNGLTTAPMFGFFMGQTKQIKGVEKLTTLEYGSFSSLIWGDPNNRAEEICFENVEQIVMPQWYIDLAAEFDETSEGMLRYDAGVFANSIIIADKVRFPKLHIVPEYAFIDCDINILELDNVQLIENHGHIGRINKLILKTPKIVEIKNIDCNDDSYGGGVREIYVPANLLAQYQERYSSNASYFKAIQE